MVTNVEAMTAGTPTIRRNLGPKQFQALFDVIEVEVTLTESSIAAQAGSQASITVPGVALGDFVLVAAGATTTGLILTASATAADTIIVKAFNVEGTDANTSLSTGAVAKLLVLHPKFS